MGQRAHHDVRGSRQFANFAGCESLGQPTGERVNASIIVALVRALNQLGKYFRRLRLLGEHAGAGVRETPRSSCRFIIGCFAGTLVEG